jgi:hypothetical protein
MAFTEGMAESRPFFLYATGREQRAYLRYTAKVNCEPLDPCLRACQPDSLQACKDD